MLREARLDAVVIVTPHALHFEHAKQALAAGCQVFIEKPMVTMGGDCASNGSHSVCVFAKGRIEVDGWGGSWLRVFGPTGPVEVNCPPMDEPNPDANFIPAIRGEAEPLVTVNDGVVQAELLEAILASEGKSL
jgi:predicted dehydrogenase